MGVPVRGSPARNLPAVELCRERGWVAGTVLRSERWSCLRTLVEVQERFVLLKTARYRQKPGAAPVDSTLTERVRSFPPDVERVEP